MKVSKSIYKILFIIAGAMTATACSDEQYEINKVEEGLPASVTLSLSVPSALETTMTRASADQETDVEKVAFLFYKKNQEDALPIIVEKENLGMPEYLNNSKTHRRYNNITISKEGLTSGEWYLYAVANYGRNGITSDKLKCTKADIDRLCTEENQITDITETAVLMSGKYGTDGSLKLEAGSNTLDIIKLKRLVAKSTFTIKVKDYSNIKFTLQSCELHKYPCSSTLMEREGWGTETNFTNPGDLLYQGNPAYPVGDKIDITNFKNEGENGPYTFFFYTQENVQKAKEPNLNNPFTYNMREERKSNDYNTFMYAPDNATYVVIRGMYEGPSEKENGWVTGNVTYTIHLGDFPSESPNAPNTSNTGSYNNFSIRRNVRYNYTVTIAGVDRIIAEALAEDDFQNGAEGDIIKQNEETTITVDAHYETVLLKLPATLGDDYALSVKTPYLHRVYRNIDEILVGGDGDEDIQWIKFGQPQSSSQFHSYTDLYSGKHGGLCNIKVLLQEWQNSDKETPTHMLKKGDNYYVTAYINEYYYADEDGNVQTGRNISDFVNADDREMTLAKNMHISNDGHSTYTETPIFSIKQKSIKSCFDLSCENPFGIETIEETDPQIYQSGEGEGEGSYSQWWSNSQYAERDGYANTCEINRIINKNTENPEKNNLWSTYINQEYNGYINGSMGGTEEGTSIMESGYDYSIYQFLTRNRDLDGDDVIDANEIRWYIPAHEQCLELWYGENSLPVEARLNVDTKSETYLTSTPKESRTWWVKEGSAFGYWKYQDKAYPDDEDSKGKNAVRVVRSLKKYNEKTTEVAEYNEDTRIVTIKLLANANIRTTSITGNYAKHLTGAEADKLPRRFKIAERYLNSTYPASQVATNNSIGNGYYEDEDSYSERGKWRIPNEKELGLMFQSLKKDLKRYTGGRTRYKEDRYYFVQKNTKTGAKFISTTNDVEWSEGVIDSSELNVRLVRDVDDVE